MPQGGQLRESRCGNICAVDCCCCSSLPCERKRRRRWSRNLERRLHRRVPLRLLATTVHALERDGQKLYRTTLEMNMVMKRYAVARSRIESTVDETAGGKVVGLTLTQFPDKGDKFTITATVAADELLIKPQGAPKARRSRGTTRPSAPTNRIASSPSAKMKPGDTRLPRAANRRFSRPHRSSRRPPGRSGRDGRG